ncbi:hypothetical protein D3C76_1667420 [compost metagenome]
MEANAAISGAESNSPHNAVLIMFSPEPLLSRYSGIPARFKLLVTSASARQSRMKHRRPRVLANSRSLRLSKVINAIINGTISQIDIW